MKRSRLRSAPLRPHRHREAEPGRVPRGGGAAALRSVSPPPRRARAGAFAPVSPRFRAPASRAEARAGEGAREGVEVAGGGRGADPAWGLIPPSPRPGSVAAAVAAAVAPFPLLPRERRPGRGRRSEGPEPGGGRAPSAGPRKELLAGPARPRSGGPPKRGARPAAEVKWGRRRGQSERGRRGPTGSERCARGGSRGAQGCPDGARG